MKTSKILQLAVFAGIVGMMFTAPPAGAAFFNFDDLPSPGPTPLLLPGVTFTPAHGGGVISELPGLTSPYPGNKCYFFNLAPDSNPTMLTITLDRPVFLVKFLFNSFALLPFVIDARDSNGNLLDSQYVRAGTLVDNLVVLCAKGIKSVVIKSNGALVGTVCIDNFSFYPLAPSAAIIPMN